MVPAERPIGAHLPLAAGRQPRLAHVPLILETPGMDEGFDAVNVARARALLFGEPLQPLPEVAAPTAVMTAEPESSAAAAAAVSAA